MGEVIERSVNFTRHGIRIRSERDLNKLVPTELLETFNRFSPKKCERFADRKSGIARTWKVLQEHVANGGTFDDGHFEASDDELAKQKLRQEVKEAKEPPKDDEPVAAKPTKDKREPEVKTETRGRPRGFSFRFPLGRDEAKPPKEGSKRYKVLELLLQPKGATFEEVQSVSGWKRTDAYEGIRLLHFANGYRLWQTEDGRIHASAEKQ